MSLLNRAWQISEWMDGRFKEADKLSCKNEEESALLTKKQLGEGDQTSISQCNSLLQGFTMSPVDKPSQDLSRVETKVKEWCEFASCNGLENMATLNTVDQLWEHIKISMPNDQPDTIVVKSHSSMPSCKYLKLTFIAGAYDLSYMMHLSRRSAAKRLGATAGNWTHGQKTQIGQQKHGRSLLWGIGEGGGVDERALWRPGAALRAAAATAGRAAAAAAARRRRRRRRRTSTCNPKAEQPLVFTGADSVPFIEGSGSNIGTAKMAICMKEPRLKKALNALRFKFLKELL